MLFNKMLLLDEQKILERSLKAKVNMTFVQFIEFNKITLDECKLSKFSHNLNNNLPIYINDYMISYFGYGGKMKYQKQCVKELIEENFSEYKDILYYIHDNENYTKFLKNLEKSVEDIYPPVPVGECKSPVKHTLIMPTLFKEILMKCQNIKGNRYRNGFIEIYATFMLYFKFKCMYKNIYIKEEYNKLVSLEQCVLYSDRSFVKKYKIGCVYFIQAIESKYINIGWCWNLYKRLSELQFVNPQKLKIIKSELCQFPYLRERELRKEHEIYHIMDNWYSDFQN
jgi:hypothetical protein